MTTVDINDFNQEKKCVFEEEKYSVRDNGAVFKHKREGKRVRPTDNKWTFGKENSANPYLHIASVRIHRIIATAFHGEPPDPKYIVDHIDTNCRNNRPENLRWISRLENALKNPVTRKKIEYLCGSIEAFLDNPSMLGEIAGSPNLSWMRTVTPDEAQSCKMRMDIWASSGTKSKRSTGATTRKKPLDESVYQPIQKWEVGLAGEPGLELSPTPWCAYYMWVGEPHFPCCPIEFGKDRLGDYFQNLNTGDVLAYYESDDICPKLTILKSKILKEKASILVMCKCGDNKWAIVGIELFKESNYFIHFVLGTYSSKEEADKAFPTKKDSIFWDDGYAKGYNLT